MSTCFRPATVPQRAGPCRVCAGLRRCRPDGPVDRPALAACAAATVLHASTPKPPIGWFWRCSREFRRHSSRPTPRRWARICGDSIFPTRSGWRPAWIRTSPAVAVWQMLGFGFAEVGTVTPRPQPGNPRPRLWRLPEHRALINRLGFPSLGMQIAAERLTRLRRRGLRLRLGVNIGPNKETPPERVADDIAALAAGLLVRWPTSSWSMSARQTRRGCANGRPRIICER